MDICLFCILEDSSLFTDSPTDMLCNEIFLVNFVPSLHSLGTPSSVIEHLLLSKTSSNT